MVNVDSPVSGINLTVCVSSGIISSFPRHQITVGIGLPVTKHRRTVVWSGFANTGLIGSMKVGATPKMSSSKKQKQLIF